MRKVIKDFSPRAKIQSNIVKLKNFHPLKLIVLMTLFLYALLPMLFVRPVGVEGFETAVTNAVNHTPNLIDATSPLIYNFGNRPGEYLLYSFFKNALGIDSLIVGQILAIIGFLITLFLLVRISKILGFASVYATTVAFLIQFDLISVFSQVTSVNISITFFMISVYFACRRRMIFYIFSGIFLSFAIFTRIDILFLSIILFMIPIIQQKKVRTGFFAIFLVVFFAISLVVSFFEAIDLSLLTSLTSGAKSNLVSTEYSKLALISLLVPFNTIFLLAAIAQNIMKFSYLRMARFIFSAAPLVILLLVYFGKIDTPRFLVAGQLFLALEVGIGIDILLKSKMRRTMILILLFCLFLSYTSRKPYTPPDGFRYIYASFLTPYEIWKVKIEKNHLYRNLDSEVGKALQPISSTQEIVIVSTSWVNFNNVLKSFIDRGGILIKTKEISLGANPRFEFQEWFVNDAKISIGLFQRTTEFTKPEELVQAIKKIEAKASIYLLTASSDVANNVVALCPESVLTRLNTSSRGEISLRATDWIHFDRNCYSYSSLKLAEPWSLVTDWSSLENDIYYSIVPEAKIILNSEGCITLKTFRHDHSGSILIILDGTELRTVDLYTDKPQNPFLIPITTTPGEHVIQVSVKKQVNVKSLGNEVWIDSFLTDSECSIKHKN